MKALNKQTAPKSVAPERIIQFGEGNFLRAFVDWIVYNMNQKTDFNGSVVVVQPIEKGMAEWLNGQDCLYHVNLQGRLNGEAVNSLTRIDCISRALNPYSQNSAFMALADQPEIRFVISNTTEAGIAFDPNCKFSDAPASSYPGKLTQLLFRRFKTFKGDKSKGLIIMPCELIFLNGHHLKECIYQYIELWKDDFGADYEKFKTWFHKVLLCMRHSGRPHRSGLPAQGDCADSEENLLCRQPGCTGRNLPPVGYRGSRESLSPPVGRGIPCKQGGIERTLREVRSPLPRKKGYFAERSSHRAFSGGLPERRKHRARCLQPPPLSASMSVKYSSTN